MTASEASCVTLWDYYESTQVSSTLPESTLWISSHGEYDLRSLGAGYLDRECCARVRFRCQSFTAAIVLSISHLVATTPERTAAISTSTCEKHKSLIQHMLFFLAPWVREQWRITIGAIVEFTREKCFLLCTFWARGWRRPKVFAHSRTHVGLKPLTDVRPNYVRHTHFTMYILLYRWN